jgi:VWFA-related protein
VRWLLHASLLLQATISVGTELVVVPANVTNSRGQYVAGLTAENFRILEDGQLRPLVTFHRGDASLTLGLIVDRSQSMRVKAGALSHAIAGVLQLSQPADEVFAVDFNDRAWLALPATQPFTNDRLVLASAIAADRAEGRTALYDAVVTGLKHLPSGHADRQALIVISDGGDNGSLHTYKQVRDLARQSGAVIYAIGLLGAPGDSLDEDASLLKRLCKDSGGVALFPRTPAEIEAVSAQIARELREQYTLGFAPAEGARSGSYRKIEVELMVPDQRGLRVRARPGYVVR